MIKYRRGDILEAEADALVNTVNCVGVMGRGIALQFKERFPDNYKAYAAACERGEVVPGRMFVFETGALTSPAYIVNFPTKRHWRGKSRLEDIEAGLDALVSEVRNRGIRSIAIPPLGSGLGGLRWEQVRPLIETFMDTLDDVDVQVFEPVGAPPGSRVTPAPRMTPGRAALAILIQRYLGALMDPFITLLEVHKLMYFLQESGQPLRLRYVKAPYGPYAENLRHVLRDVEGHLTSGFVDDGDTPRTQLTLLPAAVDDAAAYVGTQVDVQDRLDRVAQLVEGYETPFGLELLATAHWVAWHEGITDVPDIVAAIHAWGARKRQFTDTQISDAVERLRDSGWLGEAEVELPRLPV